MKSFLTACLCLLLPYCLMADNYATHFTEQTLRIDYVLSGDAEHQYIALDELYKLPLWAGRRTNMSTLCTESNGEVCMTDAETGKVLYRNSFSCLFQEWVCEEEAKHTHRAFEHTVLLPYPKRPVHITLSLRDAHHRVTAQFTHTVDPTDILIHDLQLHQAAAHRTLINSGSYKEKIDLVILAEGYTATDSTRFYHDAQQACRALFAHAPFDAFKERFNVVAVMTPSADEGVSIPGKGAWKRTAFDSHFNTFYSDRYLTTRRIKKMHNYLATLPYEHLIILANTTNYGGGGIFNSYLLTAAHHPTFEPVVVHEFGHSFAGLADEYAYTDAPSPQYPYDVEPWEPNITTMVDFDKKWKDLLPPHTPIPTPLSKDSSTFYTRVGVFEGAGYSLKGIYRPTQECRMKINEAPTFCPVCQRAIERIIRFYTE